MRQDLHVECAGSHSNPVVLFLHGFLGSGEDWSDVVSRLGEKFYCVCIDLPGHGRSTGLSHPSMYTFNGAASGVLTVVRRLHVRSVMLVGYSMGGRLALALAIHAPNVFSRLVLESASPGLKREEMRAARAIADDHLAAELESKGMDDFLSTWYGKPLFSTLRRNPEILDAVVRARGAQDPAELARALRGMTVGRQESYWDRMSNLVMSTLMVSGELDEAYVDLGGEMAGLCLQGVTAIVPNAGHNAHRERPDAFSETVGEFLA